MQFRHLMEARDFGAELLRLVNVHLAEKSLKVARGTIVDATVINAPLTTDDARKNCAESKVRAKVEHVFLVLKCRFGLIKVRYRGIAKNAGHLFSAFVLVNIVMAKRRFLRMPRA